MRVILLGARYRHPLLVFFCHQDPFFVNHILIFIFLMGLTLRVHFYWVRYCIISIYWLFFTLTNGLFFLLF